MTDYAIGYLRRDVSGVNWQRDEARIHAAADERRWTVILVVLADPIRQGAAINRLMNLAYAEGVDAVIVPGLAHFEHGDISALVKIADVVCADTGNRYTVPMDAMGDADDPVSIVIGERLRAGGSFGRAGRRRPWR
ncbi:hypothetical protein ACIRRA_22020 [Nocardia sp. NPDC101769]|uniref:hypothetical protein n=1 Tax=Nocardia sp. NPDC101769 TaxID=3364333 RepID=UPI0037F215F0